MCSLFHTETIEIVILYIIYIYITCCTVVSIDLYQVRSSLVVRTCVQTFCICSNLLYMLYIHVQTNQTIDIGGWERKRKRKGAQGQERGGSIVWIPILHVSYMFWQKHWLEPLKNSKRLSFRKKKMAQICSPQRTMYMYVFVIYK